MPLESEPLALVTADLFGPVTATHLGKRYMLLITDSFSRYTVAYFLVTKGEAAEYFVTYRVWAEKQTGKKLRRLHTDGGGEFVNGKLKTACEKAGIEFTINAPYSSSQNGIVERHIGITLSDSRAMLHESHLSSRFWALASHRLRNRIPNRVTPHELFFSRKPRTDHLRVFGCAAYAWIPDARRHEGKLSMRAKLYIFVGFVQGTSNVRLYDPKEKTFTVSRDVRFLEDLFPSHERVDLSFLDDPVVS